MQVTSYQMHNVIECYSKKLSRAHQSDTPAGSPSRKMVGELAIAPETARKATMEKIWRQVLDKIADVVALRLIHKDTPGRSLAEGIDSKMLEASTAAQFTLNVVDSINRKHTANLIVKDSAALIRRIDN